MSKNRNSKNPGKIFFYHKKTTTDQNFTCKQKFNGHKIPTDK